MSTLKATNLQNASSASVNIALDSSGNATVANNLSVDNDLKFDSGFGSTATAYGVRAWIQFAGDGSNIGSGRGSGNIDAVTDNGTGDYTLDFTNNMPDSNYAIFAENGRTGTTSYARCTQTIGTPAVGSFRIQVRESSTNSTVDDNNVYVCVVR